ncbi:MAG: LytTR family transcriptional regulator DNA-binding domain-containing protein [Lachnospiraceae bacterium]
MITIGICDDDKQFIDQLYKILQDIMLPISDWQARIYHNGSEVLAAIANDDFDCNLLFTDIYMEQGDGLSLAKYICEHKIDTDIIFVSNSKDYVFECYHYHTFAYLLKPLSVTDVGKEITRYMEEMAMNTKCLNLPIRGTTYKIPINTILFIESNRRKITIHTARRDYDYYEKLDVMEQMLKKDGFIRCHQSYLIPSDRLVSYSSNNTVILDGMTNSIPVSRRYQPAIKALFEQPEKETVEAETAVTEEPACYLTSSLLCNQPETGAFICTEGAYVGSIIRIKPEQCIRIGRDGSIADMIVNLPLVSRLHCEVIYHAEQHEYEITDFSSNGTFVNGDKRLVQNETYLLKPGTELCFGDRETIYKLG